jgi:hypothetical protein
LWLQQKPQATAKSLFGRLDRDYPGRFPEAQLRTLQRRIREWRQVMARQLVYGCLATNAKEACINPVVVGADAQASRRTLGLVQQPEVNLPVAAPAGPCSDDGAFSEA